jgi:hypothetical protein
MGTPSSSILRDSLKRRGLKVVALMTAPRYEAVWARNMIETAMKDAGVPLVISAGVFYGQCMQRMLDDAVAAGVELAITVDFDSVFTGEDVKYLMGMMATGKYDCIAALQPRRSMPYPLFTCGADSEVEFAGEPLEVTTAHFGLTGIDLTKLATVPKPWFMSVPTEDGEWSEGKVDDDIYFWRAWRDAGLKVYVDGGLSIGHLEEMVARFDSEGRHQWMYPNDWFEQNISPKTETKEEPVPAG